MYGSNLPPGCSEWHIPGNRPEDVAWERMFEKISDALPGRDADRLIEKIQSEGLDFDEAQELLDEALYK